MSLTTDPVADFLSRIRNAMRARHAKVDSPASKLKLEIARILKEEGFIANFKATEEEGRKVLRVYLKYGPGMERVITDLQRVSRPGCRIYCRKDQIPRVYGGLGINILSTSRGVMSGRSADNRRAVSPQHEMFKARPVSGRLMKLMGSRGATATTLWS